MLAAPADSGLAGWWGEVFSNMVSEAEDAGAEKTTFTKRLMSFKAKDQQLPYNGIASRY